MSSKQQQQPSLLSKELIKELGIDNETSLIKTKEDRSLSENSHKKRSAKQKEREKKKLKKLVDKKQKQNKMKDILASLQQHQNDIKGNQFDNFLSAKTLGQNLKPQKEKRKEEPVIKQVVEPEPESEEEEIKVQRPVIMEEVKQRVEENFVNMEETIRSMRREIQESLNQQIDSDEEQKKEMSTYNQKLSFINQVDKKVLGGKQSQTVPLETQDSDIKEEKNQLPIIMHEREIMESIENEIVTIVCGETGSGKSTQIPQFILKSHQANSWKYRNSSEKLLVGITQPRRVAAVSLAKRVSEELGSVFGEEVGYQIRYDSKFYSQEKTNVKFMTDGILLKEIETDFLLKHYSVIIIDEAHERSLNSDILVSLLTRISHVRCEYAYNERKLNPSKTSFENFPLRIVIMSATMRVEDFRENKRLFPSSISKPPKVIKVDARQYPVTVHYNKVTKEDYVEEAYKKVVKIHKNLPQGGILVFLTGKKEIMYLCSRLQMEFKNSNPKKRKRIDSEESLSFYEGIEKEEQQSLKVQVMPLYSQMNPEKQYKIFEKAKEGHRLIVVATNVAETSITIPGIKYVVDSGRAKEKIYDKKLSISTFKVTWISQASAEQRAGRAGRVGPGHCYRLFSTAVFQKLEKYSEPEILKTPLDQTLLQLKAIGVQDLLLFPYVTRPPLVALKSSLRQLVIIGALEVKDQQRGMALESSKVDEYMENGRDSIMQWTRDPTDINDLGLLLSKIPISPKYSKMLIASTKYKVLQYAIMIVACMTVPEIFTNNDVVKTQVIESDEEMDEQDPDLVTSIDIQNREKKKNNMRKQIREQRTSQIKAINEQRSKWRSEKSELIMYAKLLSEYFTFVNKECEGNGNIERVTHLMEIFCNQNQLQPKAIKEIHYLCLQLQRILIDCVQDSINIDFNFASDSFPHPTEEQEKILQQIIIIGLCENIARKAPIFDANGNQIKQTSKMKATYESQESKDRLYLHPLSPLYKEKPEYMTYTEIYSIQNPVTGTIKHYLKGVTKVDNLNWIFKFCSPILLKTTKPINEGNNTTNQIDLKLAKTMSKNHQLIQYDEKNDQIQVYVRAFYGSLKWDLSIQQVNLSSIMDTIDSDEYYSHVAFAILDGMYFTKIRDFKKFYTGDHHDVLDKANITAKVTKMITQLKNRKVDNKHKLVEIWEQNPYFLLDVMNLWVKESYKQKLREIWPPL